MTGRRLLGGYAILAYIFLYAPILVVVIFAFNGSRDVLFWQGFSTQWFEMALRTPEITNALKLASSSRSEMLSSHVSSGRCSPLRCRECDPGFVRPSTPLRT